MKRRKLLLYATFNFLKAVLVQSNHIGVQYKVEQYVLNKKHLTLNEQLRNFLNSKLASAYFFSFAFLGQDHCSL